MGGFDAGRDWIARADIVALVENQLASPGVPSALVLAGDAGIGKSTLLATAVAQAAGQGDTVLAVHPAEAEAAMAFTALGDLLELVPAEVFAKLDPPARHALEVAMVRRLPGARPPTEREIGVGLLTAVRHLASARPVLVAIDDMQWLDPSSAEVLSFVLRRLDGISVRVVLAHRTGEHGQPADPGPTANVLTALAGLAATVVQLGPMSDADIARLVTNRFPGTPPTAVPRIAEAAQGNPYWALELAAAVETTDAGTLPLTASLQALVQARVVRAPATALPALLVVAAQSGPTWGACRRALTGLVDDPDAALDAAILAGLVVESAGHLRPAHPLLGSAALQTLTPSRRRRLHRRLAEVTATPEQHARHLALSHDGDPDAGIAAALDAGIQAARFRGATRVASDLAELAAHLTPPGDRADQARRLYDAAELAFTSGDLERARTLGDRFAGPHRDSQHWPRLMPLLVESTYWTRGRTAAQDLVRGILDNEPATDPTSPSTPHVDQRRVRAVALACAADVGDGNGTATAVLAEASLRLFDEVGDTDPGTLAGVLVMLADERLNHGHGVALELLDRAVAAEERQQATSPRWIPVYHRAASTRGYHLKLVDNLDGARAALRHAINVAHAESDDSSIPALLGHLALTECWAGNYTAGIAAANEGLVAITTTGGVAPAVLYAARGLLAVLTGDPDTGRTLVRAQLDRDRGTDPGPNRKTVVYRHILGLADLLAGDAGGAVEHLGDAYTMARALGIHEPGRRQRLEGDLGQALVATGEFDRAFELAAEHLAYGERTNRPTLVGIARRIEGLALAGTGRLDDAVDALRTATAAHRDSPLRLELARSELALAQVYRRLRNRPAARTHVRHATQRFAALGASAWQRVAEAEAHRLDAPRTGAPLTPAEHRVVTLARAGRSNKEIAAELFLSPRTVEGHLAGAYRKLGIRGRNDLLRSSTTSLVPEDGRQSA